MRRVITVRTALSAALLLVGPLGCPLPQDGPAMPEPDGTWFAGDLHVHAEGASNDTGEGGGRPPAIKAQAIERGLDFLVLTDHSNSTGSDPTTTEEIEALFNMGPEFPYHQEALDLSDETFVMRDGNELSPIAEVPAYPAGHIGCQPPAEGLDTDSPFTDRPFGAVTGGDAVAQAKARGCFAVVNHPYSSVAPWIEYDWTSFDYDAFEVWNGGLRWDQAEEDTLAALICDHLAGRRTAMVGGSDMHRLTDPIDVRTASPLAYPTTHVLADELTWPALLEGLKAGHTMLADPGMFLDVAVLDADGLRVGRPGDVVAIPEGGRIDIVATAVVDASLQVLAYDDTSCVDPRAPNVIERPVVTSSERLLLEYVDAEATDSHQVEASALTAGMVVLVRLDSDAPDGHAVAAPITFE